MNMRAIAGLSLSALMLGGTMVACSQGGIATAKGPAGKVVLFDCNAMHGSNSNITPLPRSNVFLVYNSVSNRLVTPFGGKSPRPEFVATRKTFKPIQSIGGPIV